MLKLSYINGRTGKKLLLYTMVKKIVSIICIITLLIVPSLTSCKAHSDVKLGNLVILGDSYSTFDGHIPDGYSTWYKSGINYTDVTNVKDTWWHRLVSETNTNLLLNSSYSGSTICNTGYDGADYSGISFVSRITKLIDENYFDDNRIDTLIVYGGLNDCWAGVPLGEIIYEDFTNDSLFSFFPALSCIFYRMNEASPNTKLVFVLESQLTDSMKSGIREICAHYSVDLIEAEPLELQNSHPTKSGMESLTEQIITHLKSEKTD